MTIKVIAKNFMKNTYYVYITVNKSNSVLYTGMTRNIQRRMYEHKNKSIKGFTSKYNINKLVYLEEFFTPLEAILAEKRIKGWTRIKKMSLIKLNNPNLEEINID